MRIGLVSASSVMISCAAALTSAAFMLVTTPAGAVPASGALATLTPGPAIDLVQHRGGGSGGYGPGPGGRPHGGGGHRGGGGGGSDGGAVAAGILGGLLLGAIIADQSRQQNAVEYCMRRYRSYDPYSRTFVGRDGRRHSCP